MSTKINRSKHIPCGGVFYEIENEEIGECPKCHKALETERVILLDSKVVRIDPMTGDLDYV